MFYGKWPSEIHRPTRAEANYSKTVGQPNCLMCRHSTFETDFSMEIVHCKWLQDGEYLAEFGEDSQAIEHLRTHVCDVLRYSPKHPRQQPQPDDAPASEGAPGLHDNIQCYVRDLMNGINSPLVREHIDKVIPSLSQLSMGWAHSAAMVVLDTPWDNPLIDSLLDSLSREDE